MNRLRKLAVSVGIFFVVFTPLLFATPALADSVSGLNVEVFTYDSASTPDRVAYTPCENAWTHVENIDVDYDGQFNGVVAGCQQEFTLVHYTGYVTFPESGNYSLLALADDGFWLSLDGTPVITDWYLKGRSGNVYDNIAIEGGHAYVLDAWYYEYGGGANATLLYAPDSQSFDVVPSSFFSVGSPAVVVVPPVVVEPPVVEPPTVEPPVVEPPVVTPVDPSPPVVLPVVDPPVAPPVLPQPPVVVPPVDPPVVPPVLPDPPVVVPPVGPVVEPKPPVEIPVVSPPPVPLPPEPVPVVPEVPVVKPVEPSQPPIASVDPATIDPQTLSPKEVAQLQEVAVATLATEPEGSSAYAQALEQLAVAAQADDIVVNEQLASTPVIGAAVVGVVNAINAIGNIGADMSPAHRAKAKKEVVAAVVATGAAVSAAAGAAGSSASSSSSGSSSSRRKEK